MICSKHIARSMKGQLKVQYYNFNQAFQSYQKQEFVDSSCDGHHSLPEWELAFFSNPIVYQTLEVMLGNAWSPIGVPADSVEMEVVPCTVTTMSFFDRLLDPTNRIVRGEGQHCHIVQCLEEDIDGIPVGDNLRAMLLDEASEFYSLFSVKERQQFLFRLFVHLCVGGQWCQYEDKLAAYLDTAKAIYKDLISVERTVGSKDIHIRSMVLKVVAHTSADDGTRTCPMRSAAGHRQNFAYLIVDPFKRQVAVLVHQFGGSFDVVDWK